MNVSMPVHAHFVSGAEAETTVVDGASDILVDFFLVPCSQIFFCQLLDPAMIRRDHVLSSAARSTCCTLQPLRYDVHLRKPGIREGAFHARAASFFRSDSEASVAFGVRLASHAFSTSKTSTGGHVTAELVESLVVPEAINGRYRIILHKESSVMTREIYQPL